MVVYFAVLSCARLAHRRVAVGSPALACLLEVAQYGQWAQRLGLPRGESTLGAADHGRLCNSRQVRNDTHTSSVLGRHSASPWSGRAGMTQPGGTFKIRAEP